MNWSKRNKRKISRSGEMNSLKNRRLLSKQLLISGKLKNWPRQEPKQKLLKLQRMYHSQVIMNQLGEMVVSKTANSPMVNTQKFIIMIQKDHMKEEKLKRDTTLKKLELNLLLDSFMEPELVDSVYMTCTNALKKNHWPTRLSIMLTWK